MLSTESAKKLLWAAELTFETPETFGMYEDDDPLALQMLNMNDMFAPCTGDGEYIPDEELPRVAELFLWYGMAGVLHWVSQRRGGVRSAFAHYNRMIDFVAAEELIKTELRQSSKRAYAKRQYMIGIDNAV
ncbi:MAG: hypothetical protein AAFN18_21155 [Cyanobacteria bacterium J06554_6]